jgi:pantothenate kinase
MQTNSPYPAVHSGAEIPLLEDPVEYLQRQMAIASAEGRGCLVIGLAGFPGAGKSTRAQALVDALNQRIGTGAAMVAGMDGFHLMRAQLAAFTDPVAAMARRGAPWTFDPLALAERLGQVRAMQPPTTGSGGALSSVAWPGFVHGVGDPVADAIQIPASVQLVLIEGLYLLYRQDGWDLSALLDECWLLDVPLEQAMERITLRHMASRGLDRSQAMAKVDANDRLNAHIVAGSLHRAHWRLADAPR